MSCFSDEHMWTKESWGWMWGFCVIRVGNDDILFHIFHFKFISFFMFCTQTCSFPQYTNSHCQIHTHLVIGPVLLQDTASILAPISSAVSWIKQEKIGDLEERVREREREREIASSFFLWLTHCEISLQINRPVSYCPFLGSHLFLPFGS